MTRYAIRVSCLTLTLAGILISAIALAVNGSVLSLLYRGTDTLGHEDGSLSPLPSTPNAVASYEAGFFRKMRPIAYTGTLEDARARLLDVLARYDGVTVVTVEENYIYVTFRSRFFRFIDDTEFLFDDDAQIIHFRSAARYGYGDYGVNKERMKAITGAFAE